MMRPGSGFVRRAPAIRNPDFFKNLPLVWVDQMFDHEVSYTPDERAQRLEDSLAESRRQSNDLLRAINSRLTFICLILAGILGYLLQK